MAVHTIFGTSAPGGAQTKNNDGELLIVGNAFHLPSGSPGTITIKGGRVYVAASTTGLPATATMYLFQGQDLDSAIALRTATLTISAGAGWKEVNWPTPVTMTPNTGYYVGYKMSTFDYLSHPSPGATAVTGASGPVVLSPIVGDWNRSLFRYDGAGITYTASSGILWAVDIITEDAAEPPLERSISGTISSTPSVTGVLAGGSSTPVSGLSVFDGNIPGVQSTYDDSPRTAIVANAFQAPATGTFLTTGGRLYISPEYSLGLPTDGTMYLFQGQDLTPGNALEVLGFTPAPGWNTVYWANARSLQANQSYYVGYRLGAGSKYFSHPSPNAAAITGPGGAPTLSPIMSNWNRSLFRYDDDGQTYTAPSGLLWGVDMLAVSSAMGEGSISATPTLTGSLRKNARTNTQISFMIDVTGSLTAGGGTPGGGGSGFTSIKMWNGTALVNVTGMQVWDGTNLRDVETAGRWNGTGIDPLL